MISVQINTFSKKSEMSDLAWNEISLSFMTIQHISGNVTYNVKQSDRNSSKTDTFHKLTTYEQHV